MSITKIIAGAAFLILFFPFISRAQYPKPPSGNSRSTYRIYSDRHGSIIGNSTTLPNGNIIYRDRSGKPTGYSTQGSRPNTRIYSDKSGSYMYRETQLKSGNSNFYDRSGKQIGSVTNSRINERMPPRSRWNAKSYPKRGLNH